MYTNFKAWKPYASPQDPCCPMPVKTYSTPPHLYMQFQPPNLPQFDPHTALMKGTLWPSLYSPYEGKEPH